MIDASFCPPEVSGVNQRIGECGDLALSAIQGSLRQSFAPDVADAVTRRVVVRMFSVVYSACSEQHRLDMLNGLLVRLDRVERHHASV